MSEQYDTLVLSGGGIKGFCLLGALQAVIDLGQIKNINNYVGTSVGAILGYLLAIGYTPIEIIVSLYTNRWLERMQYFNLVAMTNGNGATSFNSLHEALEKLTLDKIGRLLTLGKLKELYGKSLYCCTYNMTICSSEYVGPDNYPDLPCLTALRMTANIPLIFDRFKYMDNYYVDGGLVDNFPIIYGEKIGKKILGIYLKIEESSLRDEPEDGLISYFLRLLQIPVVKGTEYRINQANPEKCTIIGINTGSLRNMMEFDVKSKTRLELFSYGYRDVKNIFDQIK
jgi:predicted patatin/cPLA2 family phospholipase